MKLKFKNLLISAQFIENFYSLSYVSLFLFARFATGDFT